MNEISFVLVSWRNLVYLQHACSQLPPLCGICEVLSQFCAACTKDMSDSPHLEAIRHSNRNGMRV